jgi:hypothetical protein
MFCRFHTARPQLCPTIGCPWICAPQPRPPWIYVRPPWTSMDGVVPRLSMEGESDAVSDLRAPASMEGERSTTPRVCAPQPPWKGIQMPANLSPYPPSACRLLLCPYPVKYATTPCFAPPSSSRVVCNNPLHASVWRRARQTADSQTNKSGSQCGHPRHNIRQHGCGGATGVDVRRGAQVAGERLRHSGGRPGSGLQRAAALRRARVSLAERGRTLYSLCVPPHLTVRASPSLLPPIPALTETRSCDRFLTWLSPSPAPGQDAEGNWDAGAIAAAADDVCAVAIMSVEGIVKVSVHYDISYFTPAKLHVRTHDNALLSSFSHKSVSLTLE